MDHFFKTYEIKGYASFDKIQKVMLINNNYIPYSDLECYEFIENIEVGTEVDVVKELYLNVFAAAIPLTTLLDDNSNKRGVYVCTKLTALIWIKGEDEPICINFLPEKQDYKLKSDIYKDRHDAYEKLQDALNKVMEQIYGENSTNILEKNLKRRKSINHRL